MENFKYNKLKYKKFKKKKAAGGAMLGIGLVLCGASIPFYFASDEDLSGFKVGGALLDIVGTILFIAGIVNLVKGKIGMDKAEQGLFRKPVNFGLTDELIYRF
ncbi:MAG: hypothetical protein GY847_23445 [Proteobacteria bacterium]|nr:hypothetical protein [Pseudomonadota bacterium]